MYTYPNSVLATTNEDAQGERFTREQLKKLVDVFPNRMPLNLEHDLGRPSVAYAENLRLEQHGDGYRVLGDIYSEVPLEATPGLSLSATSIFHEPTNAIVRCYLPYPAYRDSSVVAELQDDDEIAIGRLQRKGLSATAVGLVATVAVLLIGPEWTIQYRKRVRPQIVKALSLISSKLAARDIQADISQTIYLPRTGDFIVILIPDRNAERLGQDIETIDDALRRVVEFAASHERHDIRRMRCVFYPSRGHYEVINVEYTDGSDLNIAP